VCAQAQQANPLYRSYLRNFESFEPIVAGSTHATAIQIGNPVSISKAVKALRATNGIVDQASEAELVNATAQVDRFGFFNDPQTGVALAVTMKLARSGAIPRGSRVVVISTAHGLKFVDFKLRFHQGRLAGGDTSFQNLPIEVSSNIDAVRSAIDGRLPA
jgi:threonine synthase